MRFTNLLALLFAILIAGAAQAAPAHDHADDDATSAAAESAAPSSDPYYFATSPTGKALGGNPVVEIDAGRELRFADKADSAAFHKDADTYIARLDEKIVADQAPLYALEVCPVTEEPLDSMGGIVDYIYGNRLVRFCCAGCISEFESDPEKYLASIDAAAKEQQSANYPLKTCLVLPDQEFEPEHDIIVGGRLFRLCCGGCEAKVRAEPAKWIAARDAAFSSGVQQKPTKIDDPRATTH